MLITKIKRNLTDKQLENKKIDWLELAWEELNKKVLKKKTLAGVSVSISLEQGEALSYGAVLYEDREGVIAIRTELESVYLIKPETMFEMGTIAFEIGNRHTPCIIQGNQILLRADHTFEELFNKVGVDYEKTRARLKKPFKYQGHQH